MSRDDEDKNDGRELDEQIARYLKLGLPLATLICAVVAGVLQGPPAVVLVLAAGALVAVIAVFWASVRTLVGESALSGADAYALGAPRAEEEQKRAVLRALKDLEFERSVGKISEEDYANLVAKYRAEAKRLLRALDEDAAPRRAEVEALVARRLRKAGLVDEPVTEPETAPAQPKKKKKRKKSKGPEGIVEKAPEPRPETASKDVTCAECGTVNDADAVFCKKCGAKCAGEDAKSEEDAS